MVFGPRLASAQVGGRGTVVTATTQNGSASYTTRRTRMAPLIGPACRARTAITTATDPNCTRAGVPSSMRNAASGAKAVATCARTTPIYRWIINSGTGEVAPMPDCHVRSRGVPARNDRTDWRGSDMADSVTYRVEVNDYTTGGIVGTLTLEIGSGDGSVFIRLVNGSSARLEGTMTPLQAQAMVTGLQDAIGNVQTDLRA
jgi:hypothetical protein